MDEGAESARDPNLNGHCTRNEDSEYARAFNQGSDARISGLPVSSNPTPVSFNQPVHVAWKLGWDHVDRYWACDALNWAVLPLPRVAAI